MKHFGIMALEELREEEEVRVEETPEAEEAILDSVDSPEADMNEADEAANDVEEIHGSITEAAQTADTLDEIGDRVEETLPEGGMREAEADALNTAVEHLYQRVGFAKSKRVFPSTESFSDADKRKQYTQEALDQMRERAGKIWAAIVEAIKKAVEYVKNFFHWAVKTGKGLEMRAAALAKKASETKGELKADAKVSQPGELCVGGSHAAGEAFVAAVRKHVAQPVLKKERSGELAQHLDMLDKSFEEGGASFEEVANHIKGMAESEKLEFGNATFVVEVSDKMVVQAHVKAEKADAGETAPLNPSEVAEVAKLIGAHLKEQNAKADHSANTVQQQANALINKIKQMAKEDGEKAGDVRKAGNGARHIVQALTAATTKADVALRHYDMKICNAALAFGVKSLGQVEGAKAATKEPTPAAS